MKEDDREFAKILGRQIRNYRIHLGLTIEEAEEEIGLTPKHLGKIERGEKLISSITLYRICLALDFNANLIFKDVEKELRSFKKNDNEEHS